MVICCWCCWCVSCLWFWVSCVLSVLVLGLGGCVFLLLSSLCKVVVGCCCFLLRFVVLSRLLWVVFGWWYWVGCCCCWCWFICNCVVVVCVSVW